VERLFTEIFGCCPATPRQLSGWASMFPCPTQAPLACAVHQIQDENSNGEDHEYTRKQHQGRQHLLNKIDLQSDKGQKPEPHPLAGFVLAEFFSEYLTDFHWNESFPDQSKELDASHCPDDAFSI
jgi:hypothetical protein